MATLIWSATMHYRSPGDERAFFQWLQLIPGGVEVRGNGVELHIQLKSRRLSHGAQREFIALFIRYGGNLSDLEQFVDPSHYGLLGAGADTVHHEV